MSFIQELKRRNVIRVGLAYVLVAWVLLQGADFALDLVGAPDWVIRALAMLAAIGLPNALIFAWLFELTPEGLKRERDIDRSRSIAPRTGRKLDRLIIGFLVVAVLVLLADRYLQTGSEPSRLPDSASSVVDTDATGSVAPAQPAADNSIAVLPFVNMSSDPEQEYFSDGVTEEILNRLAGVPELQVVARTSVFSFKGQNQDVREIARLLGVGTILEGSVRKAGDQVRVTAQLIRASDGFHLWSEAYDRRLENIFEIQDDIANQIADALQLSLGVANRSGTQSDAPVKPQVYDLYLRARALHRQRGEGLLEAIDLFEQALAINPQFAPAWAGLAHAYIVLPNYISTAERQRIGDISAKSQAAAQRALELDPDLPTALHAMGNTLFFQFEWARAEDYYRRALQLDPDSTDLMEDYASLLSRSWQLDAARQVSERMIALDPYVPIFLQTMAVIHHMSGEFEQRDALFAKSLAIAPDLSVLQYYELLRLLQSGLYDEARRYVGRMNPNKVNPQDGIELVDWMADPLSNPGRGTLATLEFNPAVALLVDRYDLWYDATRKNGEEWSEWELDGMIDLLAPIATPERMRAYRADPRSKALIRRLRLPEYWREVGWPEPCRPLGEDDFTCE